MTIGARELMAGETFRIKGLTVHGEPGRKKPLRLLGAESMIAQ